MGFWPKPIVSLMLHKLSGMFVSQRRNLHNHVSKRLNLKPICIKFKLLELLGWFRFPTVKLAMLVLGGSVLPKSAFGHTFSVNLLLHERLIYNLYK